MERVFRIIFLALFVLGFIGAVASANRTGEDGLVDSPIVSLIRDVRLAQEVNQINSGRWNMDSQNDESLSRVENFLKNESAGRSDQPAQIGHPSHSAKN